jgi:filamentous hemagglutinin family protein
VICSFALAPTNVKAQITPDDTVNTETQKKDNNVEITGGQREGNNLFHSFEEFSIPTGEEATFLNSSDIENIFTRVTGDSASSIDGILRAQGNANFFLLNPNGIVFGQNAALDIGGSFVGSTANSVEFADGTEFSADDANPQPVLTVHVPVGLGFMGNEPAPIIVNGNGQGTRDTSEPVDTIGGLRVQSDRTLALVGGDIRLDGGTLKTAGGRIELGSVAAPGLVKLDPISKGIALGYQDASILGNIQLSNFAAVDASGDGGGDIQVTGKKLTLLSGGQIAGDTLGSSPGGTLSINASDTIEMKGIPGAADSPNNTQISTETVKEATGNGGNIKIDTGNLILRDEAQITSSINGSGDAGSVDVSARDSIEIIGKSEASDSLFGSAISTAVVDAGAVGNGGNLTIKTGRLTLRDGGVISVDTFGRGEAGNLFVKATDSVELIGKLPDGFLSSRLSALTEESGNGGNINVETEKLFVRDEATIAVSSEELENGDTGTIFIDADSISLDNAGSISATSASGNGGDINIDAQQLSLEDESRITAEAGNDGNGGNINIKAILIDAKKNSDIIANAFEGNGGKITIDTKTIVRSPDSEITASSARGINGTVNFLNNPEGDLRRYIILKDLELIDSKKSIEQSCLSSEYRKKARRFEFTDSRSIIPITPDSNIDLEPVERLKPPKNNQITVTTNSKGETIVFPSNNEYSWKPGLPVIEANAVVQTNDGRLIGVHKVQPEEAEEIVCPARQR